MLAIYLQTRINPELGPPGPKLPLIDRLRALKQASVMIVIVVITIGGIYVGAFSPTEAAGVGAFLTLLLAFWRRRVTGAAMTDVMSEHRPACRRGGGAA